MKERGGKGGERKGKREGNGGGEKGGEGGDAPQRQFLDPPMAMTAVLELLNSFIKHV